MIYDLFNQISETLLIELFIIVAFICFEDIFDKIIKNTQNPKRKKLYKRIDNVLCVCFVIFIIVYVKVFII